MKEDFKAVDRIETLQAIRKRSSTRGFTSEPLTEEELKILLHAGLQAPTATNRQEIHFTVLKRDHGVLKEIEEEFKRLRGLGETEHNFYYEAPVVIILSMESDFRWSEVDAGIAVENIALAAEALGLGSLIIGCIRDALLGEKKEYFSARLELPENYKYGIAIAAGHKAVSKEPHTYDENARVNFLR